MTPFVPLVDGAQVEIIFSYGGQPAQNRLWFVSRQPPIDAVQIAALAVGVEAWHRLQVMPLLSSALTLVQVEASDWTTTPSPLIAIQASGTSGGASSDGHSANVADRVWFLSSFSQGRIRNSNFIPGIPKDAVDLNTVSSTFRSGIFDAYVNLIDLAAVFGVFPAWRWACSSSWDHGALRSVQLARRIDFVVFKKPTVAQRRRRLPPHPS